MKTFKKNQRIVATLPTGRHVEGFYIEPYGINGHSFYVNEFSGIGRNGEPIYKKAQYGVSEELIDIAPKKETDKPSLSQYKAWLKRAIDLTNRIDESTEAISKLADSPDKIREEKKLKRFEEKLSAINAKIKEYEEDE